ncbi:YciI family protein [Microbacterium sp.]|uniref:YciI family protein n=1 Tax=Microbacterium sp. TaxID=51671 RepID=UPI003C757717
MTMMHWLAIFTDDLTRRELRPRLLDAHLEYLRTHVTTIRLAGAIRPDSGSPWEGAVWIIAADSRNEAARLCEEDPFFKQGLRSGYQVFQWGRAPHFGAVGTVPL